MISKSKHYVADPFCKISFVWTHKRHVSSQAGRENLRIEAVNSESGSKH